MGPDAHEELRDNPVVLVGESYGGIRAASMLYMLQHHADGGPLAAAGVLDLAARAPFLSGGVKAHFDLAFPEMAGQGPRACRCRPVNLATRCSSSRGWAS